jgi:hypothetical protein
LKNFPRCRRLCDEITARARKNKRKETDEMTGASLPQIPKRGIPGGQNANSVRPNLRMKIFITQLEL